MILLSANRVGGEGRGRKACGLPLLIARAVGEALAALDMRADRGMRLPALHLLERADPRVLVVEADDEADRDEPSSRW